MEKNILKNSARLVLLSLVLVVTGCASVQKPVEMNASQWKANETALAILVKPLPKPYTHKLGAQGILDIAINNAVATGVTKHVAELDLSGFNAIKTDLDEYISKRGVKVSILADGYELPELEKVKEEKENYAKVDYTPLKGQLKVDQLLIVQVTQLGTVRNYYGFIPLNAPRGSFAGLGQLIDLSTNQILWHKPVYLEKKVEGKWDQPKDYPNLTKTILEVTSLGRTELVSPFNK